MPSLSTCLIALLLLLAGGLHAESVHQSLPGAGLFTGSGKNAVEAGEMETRTATVDGAQATLARTTPALAQWGFVTAWFGLPAPAGASIVRLRLVADPQPATVMNAYISIDGKQVMIGTVAIPAATKPGEAVTIDLPVNAAATWNGFVLKKAEAGAKPGPWIASVAVVLP